MKNKFIEIFKDNIKRPGADKLLEWLEKSDFFTAPASSRFHLCCEGGLLKHSLNVYNRLLEQAKLLNLQETPETLAIVSLLHDLCKVNYYKSSTRNVKNEITGVWEKVPCYTVDEKFKYGGHGSKSVFLIMNFMPLTPIEATAINCHMKSVIMSYGYADTKKMKKLSKPDYLLSDFKDILKIIN